MFKRIILAALFSINIWLSGFLYILGYTDIKEEVENLVFLIGPENYLFHPDTRLFGLTLLLLLSASHLGSKVLGVSFGKVLWILIAILGVIMILTPKIDVIWGN